MRRREFIKVVAGSAASWPLGAHAQQPERIRRIGSLTGIADDPIQKPRLAAFLQALQHLGWTDGDNVRVEYRWGGGDADRIRNYAAELVCGPGRTKIRATAYASIIGCCYGRDQSFN
jgi:putative ABC transport system substrate-binding protein